MSFNAKLVSVGGHTLRYRHLLVIAILAASVAIAFLIRAQPVQYGFELNEFDPFFNYRATLYMVENGIPAYYEWHDTMSWYPNGRDISATSQVALHITAAITYSMFEGIMSVYDYTIIFPAIFGAFTAVVLFALVRVIGGTTAGLFAAMLYSISLPILVRSPIGWFKSEPFGLFLSILAAYLFVSGLYSANRSVAAARLIAAGLFVSTSVSAWGGNIFFVIPIGILFLALPFLRKDHNFLIWAIPLFATSTLVTSFLFERGLASTPLAGIALVMAACVLVACLLVQKKSTRHKTRNGLIFIGAAMVVLSTGAIVSVESGIIGIPEYRYLNALNPFLTTEIPLVESVSEHATTTLPQSFLFHSVLMIFAGIGIWLVARKLTEDRKQIKDYIRLDMLAFALIVSMTGVYISSSYVRLEVFAAISVITMASLGLSMLSKEFFAQSKSNLYGNGVVADHAQDEKEPMVKDDASYNSGGGSNSGNNGNNNNDHNNNRSLPSKTARAKVSSRRGHHYSTTHVNTSNMKRAVSGKLSISFMIGIVALLLLPLTYSVVGSADVFSITDTPPTILTGGASFAHPTNDWLDALSWIKNSTPPDSIIASWWDYGYWISTVGERASLADNGTLDSDRIEKLADMFIRSPDEAWQILQELQADYILVFVAGQLLPSDSPTPLYTLQNGGDESKKQWFMRIGGHDVELYLHMDGISGTEYFWENTAVAHLFPFSVTTYVNPNNPAQQFPTYVPGSVPIYQKDIKYPADGNGPFRLAYSSPSFNTEVPGPMIGIFIYEVNGEYDPDAGVTAEDTMIDFDMIMQQQQQQQQSTNTQEDNSLDDNTAQDNITSNITSEGSTSEGTTSDNTQQNTTSAPPSPTP